MESTMQQVTIPKSEFVTRVTTNRDAHKAQFIEAMAGYKAKALEWLKDQAEKVEKGESIPFCDLPIPKSHLSDYERALLMVQLSVEDQVVLEGREFAQFIMDEWDWKRDFAATSAMYGASR